MNLKDKSADEKEIKLEIGRRIREQRKANGFKTSQTYRDLEIPRTTYTGYEMGSRTPDPATMNRIATYLNTTVSYLMCETNDPSSQPVASFEEILKEKTLTYEGKPLTDDQWEKLLKTLKTLNANNSTNTNTNTNNKNEFNNEIRNDFHSDINKNFNSDIHEDFNSSIHGDTKKNTYW